MKPVKAALFSLAILFLTVNLYANITVIKTEGSVSYREGTRWLPLKNNQTLPDGTKVSTGANSYAELKLNSINHTVKLKPFTMIQVFSKETKTDTDTRIGLKRGGVTAKVPKNSKIKTIFKVCTPIATSSVRGTEEEVTYGPANGMTVKMLSGEAEGENLTGQKRRLYGRLKFHQQSDNSNPVNPLQQIEDDIFININGNYITDDENSSGNDGSEDDYHNFLNKIDYNSKIHFEWN